MVDKGFKKFNGGKWIAKIDFNILDGNKGNYFFGQCAVHCLTKTIHSLLCQLHSIVLFEKFQIRHPFINPCQNYIFSCFQIILFLCVSSVSQFRSLVSLVWNGSGLWLSKPMSKPASLQYACLCFWRATGKKHEYTPHFSGFQFAASSTEDLKRHTGLSMPSPLLSVLHFSVIEV